MESTKQQADMMTLAELAKRLGISMTAAYDLANQNALPVPVVRVGRRFLFSRTAYERLLAAQHDAKRTERT